MSFPARALYTTARADPRHAGIHFSELADRWLLFKRHRWEPDTTRKIGFMVRLWLRFLGSKVLAEIEPLDIQEIYLRLSDQRRLDLARTLERFEARPPIDYSI